MHCSKIFCLSLALLSMGLMIELPANTSQPNVSQQQLITQQYNNGILTLPNNQTSGIWFNNAPGYKVNCVNQARFDGRSCVCTPPATLNKVIETYDGAITSTVWQCRQVQDEYRYKE